MKNNPKVQISQKRGFYTTFDLARATGLHPDTILKNMRSGRIPSTKIGGRYCVLEADLLKVREVFPNLDIPIEEPETDEADETEQPAA